MGDETPCETRTRVLRWLGGWFEELDEPQEIKLKLNTMRLQDAGRARFKRGTPKDMKNLDLSAKLGIIADRYLVLADGRALLRNIARLSPQADSRG